MFHLYLLSRGLSVTILCQGMSIGHKSVLSTILSFYTIQILDWIFWPLTFFLQKALLKKSIILMRQQRTFLTKMEISYRTFCETIFLSSLLGICSFKHCYFYLFIFLYFGLYFKDRFAAYSNLDIDWPLMDIHHFALFFPFDVNLAQVCGIILKLFSQISAFK